MKRAILVVLIFTFSARPSFAGQEITLESTADKLNYSLGHQVGGDFKKQGIVLDAEAFRQGILDAMAGISPAIPKGEMGNILLSLKQKIVAEQDQKMAQTREGYRGENRAFLISNAQKPGVVSLPSGLQYTIISKGTGGKPTIDDTVTIHYRGTTLNDREFGSTYHDNRPAIFQVTKLIKGLQEALLLMQEGDKWKIFIPADLAYGEAGPLADQVVIYELQLIAIAKDK